ncbi:uncharacterized protein LOC125683261 isoform X2 [Ostrea edulis]|uniref:uncharacterized protein LOC125683261 isoform X2 n=1 Tax=Ostrea edulis TaxID=37623 RepID=UPI0024AE8B00|nr:uncharacterized protein LOC125683261 isoform X2 [Ostrea edulis]
MDTYRKRSKHTATEHQSGIKIERPHSKPKILEELISILRKILDFCVSCVTCGCCNRSAAEKVLSDEYGMILLDNEKRAVENLILYLNKGEKTEPVLSREHIRALSILSYSDNYDLQRSASLCMLEISERKRTEITEILGKPLVELVRCKDLEIQKNATHTVSNFCAVGENKNKAVLLKLGVLEPLVELLQSRNVDVQCNTCGCITALTTTDASVRTIMNYDAVRPLIHLMRSPDIRVQRNAAGAILNITHTQSNRNELVSLGVIPVIVEVMHTSDNDTQNYTTASLSNLAVNPKHRAMMVAVGHFDVIRQLVKLLSAEMDRVKSQACFTLRNLALEVENQSIAIESGVLSALHHILTSGRSDTLAAAASCLRNFSSFKFNEASFMQENLMPDLCHVVCDSSHSEAQAHIVGTIRNLATSHHLQIFLENDGVEALTFVLQDLHSTTEVLQEVTDTLSLVSAEDEVKQKLIQLQGGKVFSRLVTLASLSHDSEIRYNSAGTLGQIFLIRIPQELKESNKEGIILYVDNFLKSPDPNHVHLALWTLSTLLKDTYFLKAFTDHSIDPVIDKIRNTHEVNKVQELAMNIRDQLHGIMISSSSSED